MRDQKRRFATCISGALFISLVNLAACSGGGGASPGVPPQIAQQQQQGAQTQAAPASTAPCSTPPVQKLSVTVSSLALTVGGPVGKFTACTQYASTYRLSAAPSGVVSVPKSVTPVVDPSTGIKLAIVAVTPVAAGKAVITITDDKGNTATVDVTVMSGVKIYATNSNGNTVTVYDEEGHQLTTSGSFPNAVSPFQIAFDSHNGSLYVTNSGIGVLAVTAYDLQGDQVKTTGSFSGAGPVIGFDSNNNQLYTLTGGSPPAAVFDEEGHAVSVAGSFNGLGLPIGIAFDPFNLRLYVADQAAGILVFDEQGNSVLTPSVTPACGSPTGIAFDTHNRHFYVISTLFLPNCSLPNVLVFDESGNQVTTTGTFPNAAPATAITFDSHTDRLYIETGSNAPGNIGGHVAVYDEEGNLITTTGTFPNVSGFGLVAAPQ